MPELPEVETVRRGLAPVMEGRRLERVETRREGLRFPFPERFVERLSGRKVERLGRRAKFLLAEIEGGETLVMHLGMSGRFTVATPGECYGTAHYVHAHGALAQHDHVVFVLEGGVSVIYNDPRRFGFMELIGAGQSDDFERLKGLGPEPLTNGFSAAWLDEALAGKASPIKVALLDQRVIAGLGNIYVCEALFRAGISPRRLSRSVVGARAHRLAPAINTVIAQAIEAGGSTLRDFSHPDGALGYFPAQFNVYDREGEPCTVCGAAIRRIVQSGRSSFYCGTCQR